MWDIIRKLMNSGTTILLTTQYLEEADQLADQIVVIDGGKVIAEGTAKELKAKVGKDRLELVFKNAESLKKAETELKTDVADVNRKEYSLTTILNDTNKDVRRVLDTLAAKDITVESLAVHKPTLDDVFLSLTGKQAEATTEEEA
jgi:ABC-2 type transport system ATP-binding protein